MDDRGLLLNVGRELVRKALAPATGRPRATLKSAETARRQRVARQEVERQVVKAAAAKVRGQVLLDLVMPNGVAMRYCSGKQMSSFGGAYQAIGEKVGDAMVGEILVEHQVRELLGST
jgi:hypothetical protein